MSNDIHLHFTRKGEVFDFDLKHQSEEVPESVIINGHAYSLQSTDPLKHAECSILKAMAPELSSREGLPVLAWLLGEK